MKVHNALSIVSSFFENLLFAGVVLGWPSLQYVLLQENYFASFCSNNSLKTFSNASDHYENLHGNNTKILFCPERDSIINLALTVAFIMQYFISCFTGIILDKFGTWIFRSFAFGCIFIAYLLLALSSPEHSWLVFLSMAMLSIGGLMIGTSNVQLSSLVKPIKGLIVSMQAGAFSSAAIVFLFVKELHNSGVSIFTVFVALAMLSILTCIRTFTLMPKGIIRKNANPQKIEYGWKEWKCIKSSPKELNLSEDKKNSENVAISTDVAELLEKKNDVNGAMPPLDNVNRCLSFRQSYRSLLFWSNAFVFSAGHLRQIFFMGCFVNWIQGFAKTETESLIDFFNVCFLATVVGSVLTGVLFDCTCKFYTKKRLQLRKVNLKASCSIMVVNSVLLTLISVLVLFRQARLSVVLIVLSQSFVYGGNWTFIGVNFPSEHYGKLLGMTQVFGGISSLVSYGLFHFAVHFDPEFTHVNVALLILSVLTFCHPYLIYNKSC